MKMRKLGRSGLEVSPLAFGGNVFGWTVDDATSMRLLDRFVDEGFNFIDTADMYSRWAPGNEGGESETVIGKWLKNSGKRNNVVIATKVGMEMGTDKKGLAPAYILQAAEDSLRRLQTDHIDLYQSHTDDDRRLRARSRFQLPDLDLQAIAFRRQRLQLAPELRCLRLQFRKPRVASPGIGDQPLAHHGDDAFGRVDRPARHLLFQCPLERGSPVGLRGVGLGAADRVELLQQLRRGVVDVQLRVLTHRSGSLPLRPARAAAVMAREVREYHASPAPKRREPGSPVPCIGD